MEESLSVTPFSPLCRIAGRYELVRLIGQGGMGEVWEARHLELDAPVAIKFAVERRLRDKSFIARFRREACALARLRHPNIVQVFDIGVYEEFPFMVMELLVGESLKLRLEREVRLGIMDTASIVNQLARALSAIHGSGMVHRDVTPANVFLLQGPPPLSDFHVKLLDFGIIKDVTSDSRVTVSGAVVGSPAYMSPEQARAEPVVKQSDLWSLGALIFRALAGQDPFVGSCVTDVLFAICTGAIPSVGPRFAGHTPALDRFFARAMARNPIHRFADAEEMAEAFWSTALAARELEPSDSGVISSRPRLGGGLERLGTTIDLVPRADVPSGRSSRSAGMRELQLFVALLGVLILGITAGLFFGGRPRAGPTAASTGHSTRLDALPPVSQPLAVAEHQASPVAAPSSSVAPNIPAQGQLAGGALPTHARRTTKHSSAPSHAKQTVDPVFGLPVQE